MAGRLLRLGAASASPHPELAKLLCDRPLSRARASGAAFACLIACFPAGHAPLQRLVDRLKRERFRAIFEYLRRDSPSPVLNLLETVQVGRAEAAPASSPVFSWLPRYAAVSAGRAAAAFVKWHHGACLPAWCWARSVLIPSCCPFVLLNSS